MSKSIIITVRAIEKDGWSMGNDIQLEFEKDIVTVVDLIHEIIQYKRNQFATGGAHKVTGKSDNRIHDLPHIIDEMNHVPSIQRMDVTILPQKRIVPREKWKDTIIVGGSKSSSSASQTVVVIQPTCESWIWEPHSFHVKLKLNQIIQKLQDAYAEKMLGVTSSSRSQYYRGESLESIQTDIKVGHISPPLTKLLWIMKRQHNKCKSEKDDDVRPITMSKNPLLSFMRCYPDIFLIETTRRKETTHYIKLQSKFYDLDQKRTTTTTTSTATTYDGTTKQLLPYWI